MRAQGGAQALGGHSAVTLRSVSKRFSDTYAVVDVSLEIAQRTFFSLLGPSGCGKTTTLRLIAGFETPSAGVIEVLGRDVTDVSPHKRPVNTVFQNYALFKHLNVFENIAFGLREARVRSDEIRRQVAGVMELVRLEGYGGRQIFGLSGGEQQRVAVARALVMHPAVLLLDEPLAALDFKLRKGMQEELKRLQREVGITFLYVTHDQEEALSMSDQVAVMKQGRIEQVGTPRDLYHHPTNVFVANFVGDSIALTGRVERGRFETATGLSVPAPPASQPGPGHLIVRPELVVLHGADSSPSWGLRGRVEDIRFGGADCVIAVRLDEGTRILARDRDRQASQRQLGERIQISWFSDVAVFVPDIPELRYDRQPEAP